jgi:hypothetical protein
MIRDIVDSGRNRCRDKELQWTLFGKDYRDIITKMGLKINRNGNEECQKVIHETLLHNIMDAADESSLKRIIMDRTILDSFAYTYWHSRFGNGGIDEKTLNRMWEQVVRYSMLFDALIYIPLNKCDDIEVVDDKFRDTDFEYRKQIDSIFNAMWLILIGLGARMNIIYGSREERVNWFFDTKEYLLTHNNYDSFKSIGKLDEVVRGENGN